MLTDVLILIIFTYSLGTLALVFMHLKYMRVINDLKEKEKASFYIKDSGVLSLSVFKTTLSYIKDSTKCSEKTAILALNLTGLPVNNIDNDNKVYLKEAVKRIKTCINSSDIIAIDDKTLYILKTGVVSCMDIENTINSLFVVFTPSLDIHDNRCFIQPNIGISVFPDNGTDTDLLVSSAFTALTRAKENGVRNYYFYTEDLNKQSLERDLFIKDMTKALEEKQIKVYYQPQYGLNESRVIGVEALVRWEHPERGLIPPLKFIELSETTGLIVPLGYYILREACRQYKEWGLPDITISINLSTYQFNQRDLAERIKEILIQENMNPNNLILEITESATLGDLDYSLSVLNELRDLGVSIAMDDFGTGYSSLSYLKKLPINILKIDRNFIKDITSDLDGRVILHTIVKLAKDLNKDIVVEGVETKEQLEYLKSIGCQTIQGYILTPPLPSSEFVLWLSRTGATTY